MAYDFLSRCGRGLDLCYSLKTSLILQCARLSRKSSRSDGPTRGELSAGIVLALVERMESRGRPDAASRCRGQLLSFFFFFSCGRLADARSRRSSSVRQRRDDRLGRPYNDPVPYPTPLP